MEAVGRMVSLVLFNRDDCPNHLVCCKVVANATGREPPVSAISMCAAQIQVQRIALTGGKYAMTIARSNQTVVSRVTAT